MRWLWSRHTWLATLLFGSLAFNLGFGTTFGVHTYRQYHCPASDAACGVRPNLLHQLGLTSEQMENMTQASERMLQRVEELCTQLTEEREKLVDLLTAAQANREAVAAQLDRIAATQRQIQEGVVMHLLTEKARLTPDQQVKFNDIIRTHVCPLGQCAPQGMPGACERHRECGRQRNCGSSNP